MFFFPNEYFLTIKAVEKALPSIVTLVTLEKERKIPLLTSTAFFISSDGYLFTNYHNVEDKNLDYLIFYQSQEYPIQVLAEDKIIDVALLKIKGNNFPYLKLGDSSKLKLGETVIAIGNALTDLEKTVSRGIISGLSRKIRTNKIDDPMEFSGLIQIDAAINPGNSGGPLINLKGEVIGINTAMILGAENIGFAIPINHAKKIYEEVRRVGYYRKPSLGIRYYLIDEEIKNLYNLPFNYGAFIVYGKNPFEKGIKENSLAEKIDLKEGDIILEINNQRVERPNTVSKILSQYQIGDKINIKFFREGEIKEIETILKE